jgi:hypothetical protein
VGDCTYTAFHLDLSSLDAIHGVTPDLYGEWLSVSGEGTLIRQFDGSPVVPGATFDEQEFPPCNVVDDECGFYYVAETCGHAGDALWTGTYRVCNEADQCDTATVTYGLIPSANPPHYVLDPPSPWTVDEDDVAYGILTTTPPATTRLHRAPAHGALRDFQGIALHVGDEVNGDLSYEPDSNYNGPDSFEAYASGATAPIVVQITVVPR